MGLVVGGFAFIGLGWVLSTQASWGSRWVCVCLVVVGMEVELVVIAGPFNCKLEISSTLCSEVIEGNKALSEQIGNISIVHYE